MALSLMGALTTFALPHLTPCLQDLCACGGVLDPAAPPQLLCTGCGRGWNSAEIDRLRTQMRARRWLSRTMFLFAWVLLLLASWLVWSTTPTPGTFIAEIVIIVLVALVPFTPLLLAMHWTVILGKSAARSVGSAMLLALAGITIWTSALYGDLRGGPQEGDYGYPVTSVVLAAVAMGTASSLMVLSVVADYRWRLSRVLCLRAGREGSDGAVR